VKERKDSGRDFASDFDRASLAGGDSPG